jgi:DNA-binding response OmpR family regulator
MKILVLQSSTVADDSKIMRQTMRALAPDRYTFEIFQDPEDINHAALYGEWDGIILLAHSRDDLRIAQKLKTTKTEFPPVLPVIPLFNAARTYEQSLSIVATAANMSMMQPADPDPETLRLVMDSNFYGETKKPQVIQSFGEFDLNHVTQSASYKGQTVEFTETEYKILALLAKRVGVPRSKQDMINYLNDGGSSIKNLDVHICKMRKKMDAAGIDADEFIKTHWGRGYAIAKEAKPLDKEAQLKRRQCVRGRAAKSANGPS